MVGLIPPFSNFFREGLIPPFSNFFREVWPSLWLFHMFFTLQLVSPATEVVGVTSSCVSSPSSTKSSSSCTRSDKTGNPTGFALSFLTSLTCAFPPHRSTVITLVFSRLVDLRILWLNDTMVFRDFTRRRIVPLQLRDQGAWTYAGSNDPIWTHRGVEWAGATKTLRWWSCACLVSGKLKRRWSSMMCLHFAMEMVGTDAGCTGGGAESNSGGGSRNQGGDARPQGEEEGNGHLSSFTRKAWSADAPSEEQGRTNKRLRKIGETGPSSSPQNGASGATPRDIAIWESTKERIADEVAIEEEVLKESAQTLEVQEATLMAHEAEVAETEASLLATKKANVKPGCAVLAVEVATRSRESALRQLHRLVLGRATKLRWDVFGLGRSGVIVGQDLPESVGYYHGDFMRLEVVAQLPRDH
uniref:Uncharacterized protein n=1 Tax=Oryza brachyantha TaxID=4533 RepID=J3KU15_ORYBR